MSNFRTIDRQTGFLLPPSVDEWLPERHLARFMVEVIDGLDLRAMSASYRGSGSASYHPAMLLGILVYGYATGVFSSRKLERATYDSVAFRFIAANDHPDHDTIAAFRRRFLKEIEVLFVQVLLLAREMGVLKMGTVALDGTKIHANASRHSALSYEHAGKIEAQLKAEVAAPAMHRRPWSRSAPGSAASRCSRATEPCRDTTRGDSPAGCRRYAHPPSPRRGSLHQQHGAWHKQQYSPVRRHRRWRSRPAPPPGKALRVSSVPPFSFEWIFLYDNLPRPSLLSIVRVINHGTENHSR